jgi:hypothetical protein
MPSLKELTADDRARLENTIDDIFEFARDVVDDPSVLDQLPAKAELSLTRRSPQDGSESGDAGIRTSHFIVAVTTGGTRRVHREPRRLRNVTFAATQAESRSSSYVYGHVAGRGKSSASGGHAVRRRQIVRHRAASIKRTKSVAEARKKRSARPVRNARIRPP